MPAELWSAAAQLAERHGTYRVARALRINFETLRRRVAEARPSGDLAAHAAGFVEITPALVAAEPPPGVVLEVSDGAGARLTLRGPASLSLEAAAIVAAFRRSGA
jgi:hypothetical protein